MSLRGAEVLAQREPADEASSFLARDKEHEMSDRQYAVYIMTNRRHTVLDTGVTNNLHRRVLEHRNKRGSAFTRKYNLTQLVYYELGDDINQAIFREKQIKAGSRQDKLDLIDRFNPGWDDQFGKLWGSAE
jgi:putative endonuclease